MFQFRTTETESRLPRAIGQALLVALASFGCSEDGSELDQKVGQVTASCALNSDCENPLVCVFERCHEPCNADSDCPYPARCVQSDRTNVFACQFPDEAECGGGKDSECNSPLVCAEDDQCRSPCRSASDCPEEQVCTKGRVCAGEREVTDDGELITAGSMDAGRSGPKPPRGGDGPRGDAGEAPSVEPEASGPDPDVRDASVPPEPDEDPLDAGVAEGAEPEPGPEPEDAGPDTSEPEDDDTSGEPEEPEASGEPEPEVESNFDYVEVEGRLEPQPNDTRDDALPLTTANIWLDEGDVDWFYVDVPDGSGAQILRLEQTQGVDLISRIDVVAGADYSPIGLAYDAVAGATRTLYVTVGPGTRTLFSIASTNRGRGYSELTLALTAEDDPHEPNPGRDAAAKVEVNTDITAQLIVPYVSATDRSADDYYEFELAQGPAIFRLLSTPSNLRYRLRLLPIGEGATQTIANTTVGDTGSWEFDVPVSGAYAVSVEDLGNVGAYFLGPQPHLFESYSFRVEQ